MNARMSQLYRSTIAACVLSFTSGTFFVGVASAILCAIQPDTAAQFGAGMHKADYWIYLGQFLGSAIVGAAAFIPARISFSVYSTCTVLGQLTASLILDRRVSVGVYFSPVFLWRFLCPPRQPSRVARSCATIAALGC